MPKFRRRQRPPASAAGGTLRAGLADALGLAEAVAELAAFAPDSSPRWVGPLSDAELRFPSQTRVPFSLAHAVRTSAANTTAATSAGRPGIDRLLSWCSTSGAGVLGDIITYPHNWA
jgi:hypothetical protein